MADIDMPVGCAEYGFGYRDTDGAKVHMNWRNNYGHEGYGKGDVLGFYISLPDGERYEPEVHLNNKGKPFLVQGQDALARVPGECMFQIPLHVSNSSICFKFLAFSTLSIP